MSLGEVVIVLITFVNHRSPALSKKPLLRNHNSKRRVTGIVLLIDETAGKGSQRSFRKAYAWIATFDASCTGDKSSLLNNLLEPVECIFVIVSSSEMNQVGRDIESAHNRTPNARHHSLNWPACSCVSTTLPASS